MRFGIVSPPTVTEFGREVAESTAIQRLAEHAPVGVLTLAAVLEQRGRQVDVIDTNQLYYDYLRDDADSSTDFCTYAADHIASAGFDVVGFGTICSSYPLTLRMAARLAEARPGTRIVLGGPQASVVDEATLREFPFVDYVLRFEAEESLPLLLDRLEGSGDVADVPGLSLRRDGAIIRTPNAPILADLDALPLPAYHRYPYLQHAHYIPLELGRGCPYGCTFCSTNDFFRRKFRLKSPHLVVEQMRTLKAEYGIALFDLIHDMFTVDRGKVVDFCQAIKESGEEFYWNCSARTDRVDDELLDLMADAGCRGIFFGIETGSAALQKTIKKRLVLSDALTKVQAVSDRGMTVAASLITGFPDETDADLADTVDFFVNCLRFENTQPQLHVLAPLADTPLHRQYHDRLVFDDVISDMSHQGWTQDSADRALIADHPDIFPNFYGVPTPLNRDFVKRIRAFLLNGAQNLRWLYVGVHRDSLHLVEVFRQFDTERSDNDSEYAADPMAYFRDQRFLEDFTRFVTQRVAPGSPAAPALNALCAYSAAFQDVGVEDPTADLPASPSKTVRRAAFTPISVPALADNVRLVDVDVDFDEMMARVHAGKSFVGLPVGARRLASRKLPGRWPEVVQLSASSAALLALCDGRRSVREIARQVELAALNRPGIPAGPYCLVGLELLRHDGLLVDGRAAAPSLDQSDVNAQAEAQVIMAGG